MHAYLGQGPIGHVTDEVPFELWATPSCPSPAREAGSARARRPFQPLAGPAVYRATVDGYFKWVNPAFERTLGYTADELVSRPFLDFVHPEDVKRTQLTIDVLGSEEIHQFENRYICRDGSIRWLQWNTRPGLAEGLVAAGARDVTS